jgi:hypothetical protein
MYDLWTNMTVKVCTAPKGNFKYLKIISISTILHYEFQSIFVFNRTKSCNNIINVFFDQGRAIPSVYATGDRQTSSRLPSVVPAGAFAKQYQKRTQETHIFYEISNWARQHSTCCVNVFHKIKLVGRAITITYKNQQWHCESRDRALNVMAEKGEGLEETNALHLVGFLINLLYFEVILNLRAKSFYSSWPFLLYYSSCLAALAAFV